MHFSAVEAGRDPLRPYEFAVAEANRCGLDVESAAPGAAVLDGGRATLASSDALIVHEDRGTVFEQALLIAHEIGHFILGDGEGGTVIDIDPARPAEACPVGADRVVDYGRRQRREIQMDLFAREFLLPREIVRTLHIEGGLTASAIADRYQAPFDVVAQQLLDALLLPVVPHEVIAARPEKALNEQQRHAAEHRGEAFLLAAGPGTGKTQTLTARVEGLLDQGVDPRRILVLTFSNKAAGEMSDRIGSKRGAAAASMWIGTFHAFGLDVIRRFHAELGLPADPRMMDRTEAAELLENEFPRLGLVRYRNIYDPTHTIDRFLSAFSRAKDEVVNEQEYAELAAAMSRAAISPEEIEAAERAAEVARAYAAYEGLKIRQHRVDFGDLVSLPVRLLETNEAVRQHFQSRYEHVLVDEYQDVNRASVRLIKALCPEGRNLWAVGDAKQSIYRFRGASSFNMGLFQTRDFPNGTTRRLEINYRSVPEIVDTFSTFARGMIAGGAADVLVANRLSDGAAPELRIVDVGEAQTVVLADAIEEMRRDGRAYRDQAVLCTGNERLATIGREFERLGIPVLFLGSLFERPEVKELLSLLSIVVDRRAMGLIRTSCRDEFTMSISDVDAVVRHLRASEKKPLSWCDDAETIPHLSTEGVSALRNLRVALDGFDQSSSPWVVLAKVMLDRTRWAADVAGSSDVADRAKGIAIWQFMNFLRVQPSGQGLPVTRLLERVRRLIRLGDDRDLRQLPAAAQGLDAVRLMTVHGAKGLEFPVVHFPGMNSDTMPRSFAMPDCPPPDGMVQGGIGSARDVLAAGHSEEQECLFYVALSRACDRLFLYAAKKKLNGHSRPLSPFINHVESALRQSHAIPSRPSVAAPEDAAVDIKVEGPLRFGATQLALYDSCPRRFLYTHVLELGGRRTMTSFMQMHEAARSVVRTIITGGVTPSGEDVDGWLNESFGATGLAQHGYAGDYLDLARAMIRYFLSTREGHSCEPPTAISVVFADGDLIVTPDDLLVRPDGQRILRRVQTGHARKSDQDDVAAAAFVLAASQAFPSAIVDIVYLADALPESQQLGLTARQVANKRTKIDSILGSIRAGRFPTITSERTCPGCPAFFVCGPTPAGTLTRKFETVIPVGRIASD